MQNKNTDISEIVYSNNNPCGKRYPCFDRQKKLKRRNHFGRRTRLKKEGNPTRIRNCKPKIGVKKSFKRSFEPENKRFEDMGVSSLPETTFEDFFGLFKTDTSTNSIVSLTNHDESRYFKSSVPISNPTSGLPSDSSTSVENIYLVQNKLKQTFKDPVDSNKVVRTVVLPSNISKIESYSNLLELKKSESPKDDLSSFFKQDEEGEAGGNLPNTPEEVSTDNLFTLFTSPYDNPSVNEPKPSDFSLTLEPLISSQYIDLGPLPKDKTSMTSTSNKHNCEAQSKKKCICSFESLCVEIHSIFSKSKSPRSALEKFKELHCSHYVPNVDTLEVSSQSKPKESDKQKKAIAVNEEKGPKEIDQPSLNDFITQSVSSEEG